MARERKRDARYDLRGGVNTAFAEDLLDGGELRRAFNARIVNGIATKRCGSRRLHTAALPNVVQGMFLWTPTGGNRQLVVIANGSLYYKAEGAASFTTGATSVFTTSDVARFTSFRVGSNLVVVIACGGNLRYWNGALLTEITSGALIDGVDVAAYKGRVYGIKRDSHSLCASKISDVTQWDVASGGLEEKVETFDSEPLVGLLVCGSSLILAKEDSIARLTGISTSDIRVDRNTDGVSSEVGVIARATLIPLERGYFFVSDRGPYLGSESSVEAIGMKVSGEFDFANKAVWAKAVAAHHRGRHEIWLTAPGLPNSSSNDRVWVYDYRNRKWDGPWNTSATALAPYERENGRETVLRGSGGGWVTEEDIPNVHSDDNARTGTGGAATQLEVTYPQLLFGDPGREKNMRGIQQVQANLEPGASLIVDWFSEMGGGTVVVPSSGYGMRSYPFRLGAKGKRITIRLSSLDSKYAEIGGAVWDATLGRARRGSAAAEAGDSQSGVPMAIYVLPAAFALSTGLVVQLQCVGVDANGVEVPIGAVSWGSSDITKATVSATGVVAWVAAGSVTITATVGALAVASIGTML